MGPCGIVFCLDFGCLGVPEVYAPLVRLQRGVSFKSHDFLGIGRAWAISLNRFWLSRFCILLGDLSDQLQGTFFVARLTVGVVQIGL